MLFKLEDVILFFMGEYKYFSCCIVKRIYLMVWFILA